MEFIRGMRDKLEKYLNVQNEIEIIMEISGDSEYDFCCFGVDEHNQLVDDRYMLFYNQKQSPEKEIIFSQLDNRGEFKLYLDRLPNYISKIIFTVSIDGNGTMGEINKHKISILQDCDKKIYMDLSGKDFNTEKAIISIEIYRKDIWRVAAVAAGFDGGLPELLSFFGGEEKFSDQGLMQNEVMGKIESPKVRENEQVEKGDEVSIKEETERLNVKSDNSEASTKVYFKYNPYTVETQILIDGVEVEPPSKLYDLKNERIQVWLDQLLPILIEMCNDKSFQIDFYGLRLDYGDLVETVQDYCKDHKDVEVFLNFTETKGSADRLEELKNLFDEMQNTCPFEDLKTKQIQENFYNALSSEFEVSVIATMSSGKSTLINALLGKELMPSKNEACTATIAKIKDTNVGKEFSAQYRDKENNILGQYPCLSLSDMEEMNANPNTAYIDIEGNIPHIDSSGIKLVLVDTPGPNNSRTEEHRNHTYRVIKEKTKPMVLYVLNATQLQTNDDFQLLSTVAEAMRVGGKQSKDRFIFAVNKIDLFDPDKESVQDALDHVREYLAKFDIINPNIFPTSAETAKVIRMQQNGDNLTKGQNKVYCDRNLFISEKQLHLSEQASLSRNNMHQIKSNIEEAKRSGNQNQEVLIHTGVPAIELAINEYLKKYAYTAKIKSAVDTFKKKVEEKDMHAKMLVSIQDNEQARNEIHQKLEGIKQILNDGKEASKFRDKIVELDMMKEAKNKIRKVRAKVSKELTPSSSKGAMTTLQVQQLMMKLNNTVQHLQSDVKTELDNIIEDVIIENANTIMKEYKEHINGLIQSGELQNQEFDMDKGRNNVDFLAMDIPNAQEIIDNYKYNERYDTGEEVWVENTSKKWYKPWTWFQKSGHYKKVYENREMVDYSTVENEYLAPIIRSFMENLESAQQTAQEEAEHFKSFFLEELSKLEIALKKKVEESEKLTQNQMNIQKKLMKDKENVQWLENFLKRLEQILEV